MERRRKRVKSPQSRKKFFRCNNLRRRQDHNLKTKEDYLQTEKSLPVRRNRRLMRPKHGLHDDATTPKDFPKEMTKMFHDRKKQRMTYITTFLRRGRPPDC